MTQHRKTDKYTNRPQKEKNRYLDFSSVPFLTRLFAYYNSFAKVFDKPLLLVLTLTVNFKATSTSQTTTSLCAPRPPQLSPLPTQDYRSMDAEDQAPLLQITDYTPENSGFTPAQCTILSNLAVNLAEVKAQSSARLAALTLRPAPHIEAQRTTLAAMENDGFSVDIPSEVQALATQFAGLPMGEISKIFADKFHPMNLYKLRHFGGCEEDTYQVQIWIDIDGAPKLRKIMIGSYKDYENNNIIWSEAFLNYMMILISFFGNNNNNIHPALYFALVKFHRKIIDLSRKYQWQEAVLPLALDFHTHIVSGGLPADPAQWEIPTKWQARFCNPLTDRAIHKRKRTDSPSSASASASAPASKKTKDANNSSVICRSFNRGKCSRANCRRKHACNNCASEDHGFRKCKRVGEE